MPLNLGVHVERINNFLQSNNSTYFVFNFLLKKEQQPKTGNEMQTHKICLGKKLKIQRKQK